MREREDERGGPAEEEVRLYGGRFQATRVLKKAQGVATLLGTDGESGREVVIKATGAATVSANGALRLEHEAQVLRDLRCPHLTPLVHMGREGELLYVVMPFVPGITLEARLERGPLAVTEALAVGRCVLLALREAHDHGVLHRDVKPANVIVEDGGPEAVKQVTLIDFGLARSGRLDESIRNQPVGTARYVAPEQAGLLDHDVGPGADLYSAGVMLYECLAGRPPFQGESVGEMLRQHLTVKPADLRSLGVPRALDEVVQKLLKKDPRDRYQSAEAAIADLEEIGQALERGVYEPALVVGLKDRRQTLTEPAFIGHEAEVERLEEELGQAWKGKRRLALVEAESGGGKTRLLDELAQRSAQRGAWVLRGQGVGDAATRPFQVLDGLVKAIASMSRDEPGFLDPMRERIGDRVEAACAVLPKLGEVLGVQPSSALGPERHGEARSLAALAALLDALGTTERPAVVLLDDCQWADEQTHKLLAQWQRRQGEGGEHVLLVAAFRSDEVSQGHALRNLQPTAHLLLKQFGPKEVRRAVESMAGEVPGEAIEVVARLSDGSPFMVAAVLRGLVEAGALLAGPDGWTVEPQAMADVQSSRQAAAFLTRRLEQLPEDVLTLLSAAAIVGKELDLDIAAALAGHPPDQAIRCLDQARARHIVWAQESGTRFAFVHDKLREALLARLSEEERRAQHRRAALWIEERDPARAFEIGYHFDAAGEHDRALPYALRAAADARAQHALEVAERYYRIAQGGASSAEDATRQLIAQGLGEVLMLRGRYDESAEQLQIALGLAKGGKARVQLEGKIGELAFKQGKMKLSSDSIERALRLLGYGVPQSRVASFVSLLWEIFIQVLHTWFPRLFLARRRIDEAGDDFLAIQLYFRLQYPYYFVRGIMAGTLWTHMRMLNLAERYPPTRELGQAYASHAVAIAAIPMHRRAIAYGEKAVGIMSSIGDLWEQGLALGFLGIALYTASRYEEELRYHREAMKLLERAGDLWEYNNALRHVGRALVPVGDLRGAARELERSRRLGLEIGESVAVTAFEHLAKGTGGKVSASLIKEALDQVAPTQDTLTYQSVMQAEGLRLLFGEDKPAEAARWFEDALDLVRARNQRNEYMSILPTRLAMALRMQAERVSPFDPGRRAALLERARKAARQGLKLARSFQNSLPQALRESALLAAMDGKRERARAMLDESLAVAARQGARFEHAQSLLARGKLGLLWGAPGAAEEVSSARQALAAMGADWLLQDERAAQAASAAPVTLSLADRFETLLDAGRKIALGQSKEAIYGAVREAALTLLRSEQCIVLEVAQPGRPEVVGGEEEKYSRTAVARCLQTGRPVAISEGAGEVSESFVFSGARSALCAPIVVRGQAVGCFYTMHRHVAGLFGEDEERLAAFVATLAGAALENAENFAKLEALSKSLEKRVEERTAQLQASNQELETSLDTLRETQEQLLQAGKMAAVGTLVAGLSHELNNPIGVILGYVQSLLKRTAEDAPSRQPLLAIERQAQRCARLVRMLLDFSRKKPTARERTPPGVLMQKVVELVEGQARQRGVELKVAAATVALPEISANGQEIETALLNMVSNAMDATSPQGSVMLDARPLARDGVEGVEISVKDTGSGIPPEVLGRIFDPFFTTKGVGKGTGLGLALTRQIVEAHGGRIEVETAVGQGTTMRVWLPANGSKPVPGREVASA